MKPITIAGILIAVLGAVVLVRGLSYPNRENVVRIGDVQVSANTRESVPSWVGVAALAGGLLLVGAGMQGKKA
jgi:drug/metabolite transporter (DMT)-like permease